MSTNLPDSNQYNSINESQSNENDSQAQLPRSKARLNRDEDDLDDLPIELVDGHLDNMAVRPKIDVDADETLLMIKLRRMLHKDDFDRIFDSRDRRIGEL